MAAAVYVSPRHHSRAIATSNTNMCNVPGCNSPKEIGNENTAHIGAMHSMKPFGSHTMNTSNHLPMSPALVSMSTRSSNYQHHSLPPTFLHQSKSNARTNSYNHYYTNSRQNKRKSAVELLAESKPFYVKSEAVLDRKQKLVYRSPIASATPHQKPTSCKSVIRFYVTNRFYYNTFVSPYRFSFAYSSMARTKRC